MDVRKVIGLRESLKALKDNKVQKVFIAQDANPKLVSPVLHLCEENQVETEFVESSRQLGLSNGIGVCASVVCILK